MTSCPNEAIRTQELTTGFILAVRGDDGAWKRAEVDEVYQFREGVMIRAFLVDEGTFLDFVDVAKDARRMPQGLRERERLSVKFKIKGKVISTSFTSETCKL